MIICVIAFSDRRMRKKESQRKLLALSPNEC
jgi:hypothetical protein